MSRICGLSGALPLQVFSADGPRPAGRVQQTGAAGGSSRILTKRRPKPRKKKSRPAPPSSKSPSESRVADAVTIAWMLCTTTTLLCELGALGAWLFSRGSPDGKVALLGGLLFFAAAVIGVVGLLILPIVLKLRRESPPLAIAVAAVLIDAAPLLVAVVARFF